CWALGAVLYELLSGSPPYNEQSNMLQLLRVCSADPAPRLAPFEAVPEPLVELIARCLEKDPAKRPQSHEIAQDLHSMLHEGRLRLEAEQSPFRGLLPFSEDQADFFYGRDDEIASMLERIRHEPLLPVVGPSGAGKSSFVQAGLIPRLREHGRWIVLRLRPGREPFEALAIRLTRGEHDGTNRSVHTTSRGGGSEEDTREKERALSVQLFENPPFLSFSLHQIAEQENAGVLLFVDQLEEIYTLASNPDVRRRFMTAVCGAADDVESRVRVVLTLRDDFLVRLAETPVVREALGHVTVLRTPGPEALRDIVMTPVRLAGYQFEDQSLVEEMIETVGAQAGALPLLQVAAARWWEGRDRKKKILTKSAYEAMGGVVGAIVKQADGVLDGLTPRQLRVAREMCLRLVTPEHTRRLVVREELLEGLGSDGEEVLRRMVLGRIVVARRGRSEKGGDVEFVHESLVSHWTQLVRWLEGSREEIAFVAEVGAAAELWDKRGRPKEEVWRGPSLHAALAKASQIPTMPERVRAFLEAGQRRERRGSRRRRVFAGVAFGVMTLAATILAWQGQEAASQRRVAEKEREIAELQRWRAEERHAEAMREGAEAAILRDNMLEARAKIRVSLEAQDTPSSRALWSQLRHQPLQAVVRLPTRAWTAKFMDSGRSVAALDIQGSVHTIDVATTQTRRLADWNATSVAEASFSQDGRFLVSTNKTGDLRVWDLEHRSVAKLGHPPPRATWFAISPNGQTVASLHATGAIHLWDVRSGSQTKTFDNQGLEVTRATFDPLAPRLASGDVAGNIRIWTLTTGESKTLPQRHDKLVSCLAFDAHGRLLATSDWGGQIRLWDSRSGKLLRTLEGHVGAVYKVRFHPDGRRLVSVSGDKTVRIWRIDDGSLLHVLRAHQDQVYDVDFDPTGETLMTLDGLGALRLWSLQAASGTIRYDGHRGSVFGIAIHPNEHQLASASRDSSIRIWNVTTGHVEAVLEGHEAGVLGVDYSPDGTRLVSGGNDNTVRLWDTHRQVQLAVLSGHRDAIVHPVFSPDGKLIASPSNDGTIRIWSAATGDKIHELVGHTGGVNQASFSPDGRVLATGADDATIRLWDVQTAKPLRVLRGHQSPVYGPRFGASEHLLVSAGWDGDTRVWTLPSGESRVVHRCEGYAFFPTFDASQHHVGATCADGTAAIVDLKSNLGLTLQGHVGHVTDMAYAPSGRWVATSGDDGTVRLWSATKGLPVWRGIMLRQEPAEAWSHEGGVSLDGQPVVEKAWQKALQSQASIASSSRDTLCYLSRDGMLKRWDLKADTQSWQHPMPHGIKVMAHESRCFVLQSDGEASLWNDRGERRTVASDATAIGVRQGEGLVAVSGKILRTALDGTVTSQIPVDERISALAYVGTYLVAGTYQGDIRFLMDENTRDQPRGSLPGLPSASVQALLEGPAETVVAGFSNGMVGVWDGRRRALVATEHLHGKVLFLQRNRGKVHALSELGDRVTLDLELLERPYCEVMRDVWDRV
ncbi:MAG TPA: protein kinase, partial [Polyangiaceae bacterium]|nr:protein kinase [Polyangiaceae bacterium]